MPCCAAPSPPMTQPSRSGGSPCRGCAVASTMRVMSTRLQAEAPGPGWPRELAPVAWLPVAGIAAGALVRPHAGRRALRLPPRRALFRRRLQAPGVGVRRPAAAERRARVARAAPVRRLALRPPALPGAGVRGGRGARGPDGPRAGRPPLRADARRAPPRRLAVPDPRRTWRGRRSTTWSAGRWSCWSCCASCGPATSASGSRRPPRRRLALRQAHDPVPRRSRCSSGFVVDRQWKVLLSPYLWLGAGIAILLWVPNLSGRRTTAGRPWR